jgi:predicted transcriptional regulator
LASQAIEDFLTVQEWHIRAINEGIAAADEGDVVSHEEAFAELKRWGKNAS